MARDMPPLDEVVSVTTELPIYVGGDQQFVQGRADILKMAGGSYEVNLSLSPEAGRILMGLIADRVPVGFLIDMIPARPKGSM